MARTPSTMAPLGRPMPAFTLPDTVTGGTVSSADFAGAPVLVMFICNHCPFVVHVQDAFGALEREFADQGLRIVAISSNDVEAYPQDGPEPMKALATTLGWGFPYCLDETQEVARAFDAACTPDFFLYDAEHRLVYRGQLDGSRPGNDVPVTGEDLRAATRAVLAGQAPPAEQQPSLGCNIKWKR
ncbi:MAG: thioredoxin family protein [Deltaproteobacteria bacterium]|nr:MAG: thioredoxin family protein [Deltaproteobacteria bacterium]